MEYKKININKARRLYNEGKKIIVKTSKMRIEPTMWTTPMELVKKEREEEKNEIDFDKNINVYAYYNCNNEMGRTLQYYIEV